MKKIQILSWYDNKVLYETEVEDDDLYPIRTAVSRASLDRASLDGASLVGASLDGASLVGASLDRASLVGASLDGASLVGASLDRARLVGASLDGASLVGARLDRARLDRASLVGASLVGASLVGARLDRARLVGASLVGASLVGARLDRARLDNIRADFRKVLDAAPNEVIGLLSALRAGHIDGSCYEGECACLVGTIAKVRHCSYKQLGDLVPNAGRPAERWFLGLSPGCTPQWHAVARVTERWILEWMTEHEIADPRDTVKLLAKKAAETGDLTRDEVVQIGTELLGILP